MTAASVPPMRTVSAYVENDAGMAFEHWSAAWAFDEDHWGVCGQGPDEPTAVDELRSQLGDRVRVVVAERIHGDEQAFRRDHQPCTRTERQATATILTACRRHTLALVTSLSEQILDWDDPTRVLPSFARWRTIRQLAWHVVDTESRYYLPQLGLGYRPQVEDLLVELAESAEHVRAMIEVMPADVVRTIDGEVWTSTKVLRRLAWHERGELVVMHALAARASAAKGRS